MDEIIATVTRLEFYRPCPWLGSVRLPQRTEWWGRRGEEHTRLIRNTSRAGLQERPTSMSAASAKSLQARGRDYYDLLMRHHYTRAVLYVHQSVRYEN